MNPTLRTALSFAFMSLVFGVAYTQAPLYYSNQNQYFLHGLADAGVGRLRDDWLANTADPTPVFSGFVAIVVRTLGEHAFYGIHVLLLGIYAASLMAIFVRLAGDRDSARLRLVFFAVFVAIHSALARWVSYRLLGWDYPWYFQAGVAGQYALGGMLQPSMFGVLLIASVAAHLWDRTTLAVCLMAGAAIMHSTYLLGAGMLTIAYVIDRCQVRSWKQAAAISAGSLLLVLPTLIDALIFFMPTSPEMFAESQRILARVRIPHHCLPRLWLDGVAAAQIAWILLGILLTCGSKLCPILAAVFGFSALLTTAQVLTDSDTLALLFPWRTSAILVPIATTIILSRAILAGHARLQRPIAAWSAAALLTLVAIGGAALMRNRVGYRNNDAELPLYDFVRTNRSQGDVFLLPMKMPNLAASTRGSLSSDFKPLAERSKDARIVPIDFQRFRLAAGAPIHVDFKSIPYKDVDVLEWRRRMEWNEGIYKEGVLNKEETVAELAREGITHVVVTRNHDVRSPGLELVYEDPNYKIFLRSR
ncbi:MAG: hypothetical protein K2X38_25055 [Gemmataceae bacterium]|nr:hypothetical protein [Gemmataceae bacterium]